MSAPLRRALDLAQGKSVFMMVFIILKEKKTEKGGGGGSTICRGKKQRQEEGRGVRRGRREVEAEDIGGTRGPKLTILEYSYL